MSSVALAADTGWVSPTSVPDSVEVENPANAFADGGGYATFHTAGTYDYARFSGYNFSIPAGMKITAITVRLDAWIQEPPYDFGRFSVAISPNGIDWYDPPSIKPGSTEATYELGDGLWGHDWTAEELSGNFLVTVQNGGFGYAYLDWVPVKVTYAPAEPPQTIPTLSEWGLIILGLLLSGVSIVFLNRQRFIDNR